MLFSQRYGFKPVRQALQKDSMDEALKNGLYNSYFDNIEKSRVSDWFINYERSLWLDFFKRTLDEYLHVDNFDPFREPLTKVFVQKWFLKDAIWYEIYDFCEFCWATIIASKRDNFAKACNRILEREMSAYRFVEGKIISVTSEVEIAAIEQATQNSDGKWSPVTQHLRTSLTMLSDRQQPDYRNSIKEAISSVESACQIITGNTKATLGDTLKVLEQKGQLHKALKEGFNKLYGYTSDAGGIRHALTDDSHAITFEEAKFMLVTCSAFVNYLRPTTDISS